MVKSYSAKPATLQPHVLSEDTLLAMGRLLRACAELEDIITLYLCKIARVGEGQLAVLLGTTPVSKKIELAGKFAQGGNEEDRARYTMLFANDVFREIWRARNVAAHGVLLGRTPEGHITFRTSATDGINETSVRLEAVSTFPNHFQNVAKIAEEAVTDLERYLDIQSLREKRRSLPLGPHTKAQPTRQPSAKRSFPPQS